MQDSQASHRTADEYRSQTSCPSSSFVSAMALRRYASVVLLSGFLFGCGGGGGSSSSSSTGSTSSNTPGSATVPISSTDASRLADQATFGSTDATVASITSMGAAAWINAQIATPPTGYPALAPVSSNSNVGCPSTAPATCYRDNYTAFPIQHEFLANAITGPDQLRQRVAFALSQIFVVSSVQIGPAYAMREYQQLLLNDAFVNYRTLLQDVTLSPVMGDYLDMVNNAKANVSAGTSPNENYGREVLQLFSIGTNQLNIDGSTVTDSTGAPVPTYDQNTVEGFASVFTGWTYPAAPAANSSFPNPQYFIGQMVPFATPHDTTAKPLLNGVILAAGQTPQQDLQNALDNIFNHPNVGPFIGKQLIQFLVTSNPSPQYIARVASVFNNNGKGVRGDMGAVVSAILLDTEARGDQAASVNFGKLREPAENAVALVRMLNGSSDGVALVNPVALAGQPLFGPQTVFSFYSPSYALGNTGLIAPQFGLLNTGTLLRAVNLADALIYGNPVAADPTVAGSIGTSVDLSSFTALADDAPTLVARLNTLMVHGSLSSDQINTITNAVNSIAATDGIDRARMAIFLVATSASFQISH